MATALSKDQKSKVSLHGGDAISTRFPDDLPMWSSIGTDVKQELLTLLIERLRENQCNDVADYVGSHREEATKALQIRFKSMKDRRRANKRKGVVQPLVLTWPSKLIMGGS